MLSDQTVEEFRRIMREDYGAEMTKQEASEAAHNLVGYFALFAKIDARMKNNQSKKSSTG